jgi:hypothetical protein
MDLLKKIVSPERTLLLSPIFDSNKYEALSVHLETVSLNGICTIGLIKSMLNTVHKLSEDVAVLKSGNALLKSKINELHEKVFQPQGSLSSRVSLQADKEIAEPSKAAPRRNPALPLLQFLDLCILLNLPKNLLIKELHWTLQQLFFA